jgi:putative FmdB family regulatory protein
VPTYDYECQKCGHTFEHFQSFREPDLRKCPECKGKLKRLIGMGAGIIFKGSGFYETDYRRAEYKKETENELRASKDSSEKKADPDRSDSPGTCCGSPDKECSRA